MDRHFVSFMYGSYCFIALFYSISVMNYNNNNSDLSFCKRSRRGHPAVECFIGRGTPAHCILSSVSERLRLSMSELATSPSQSTLLLPVYDSIILIASSSTLEMRLTAFGRIYAGCSSSQIGCSSVPRLCTIPECAVCIWFLYHVPDLYFFLQYGY